MNFWKFIFSFLYTRNWHTGQHELSRPRLTLFLGAIFLVILAFSIITFLQATITYSAL